MEFVTAALLLAAPLWFIAATSGNVSNEGGGVLLFLGSLYLIVGSILSLVLAIGG